MKLTDYILEKDGDKAKCPICGKSFKVLGMPSHFHRSHNPDYKNMGSGGLAKVAWNKGLTKDDPRVAKNAASASKTLKGRPGKIPSKETKAKTSASMVKAHAEGRAHNIGKSRWNNEPSWPEQFFTQVIENEFDDKNYETEYPFGLFSLDFAWPHLKKVIEIDGDQHQRFEEYKARDARKDAALKEAGWQVHRVVWKEMYANTKEQIALCKEFLK